jgi:hypothetical protein
MTAQDQALQTKCNATEILKTEIDSKCRIRQKYDERTGVVTMCPTMAKEQCRKRHDRVRTHLHFNTCKETGVKLDKKHWCKHVPKSVETSHKVEVTILWNNE